VVAKKLHKARQEKALSELFQKADVTRDGSITVHEFLALCDEHGAKLSEEDLEEFHKRADENGEITKEDFIILIKNSNLHKDFEDVDRQSDFYWKKKADLAFRIFDRNKDGYINKKEFRMMTTASKFPMKKIEAIFELCDENGDGKLDYKEFTEILFRHRARQEEINKIEESLMTAEELQKKRAKERAIMEKKNQRRKIKIRCK